MLRLLTPQDTCRPLDIYPIKLTQDAIYVDVGAAASSRAYQSTRGGADSSIERNNVYALQPKSYIQGQDPSGDCACRGMSLYEIRLALVPVNTVAISNTSSNTITSSNIGTSSKTTSSISTSTSNDRLEDKAKVCHYHPLTWAQLLVYKHISCTSLCVGVLLCSEYWQIMGEDRDGEVKVGEREGGSHMYVGLARCMTPAAIFSQGIVRTQ